MHFIYKADKIVLLIVFGLALYIPLISGIYQKDKLLSKVEQRNLAKLPAFPDSTTDIKKYPEAFNSYYSDHFGLREQITEIYFSLMYKFGAQNSVGEVTFGQDGWMFLGNIKPVPHMYGDPMGDAINKNLYTEKQLAQFARSIVAIKNWLNKQGIAYIYVIVPNKHTIYHEKLPSYISKMNQESAIDQVLNYIQAHTDVMILDLRQALFEEKKKHQVYFKHDSHWTYYGANAAQFEIMKKIKTFFPEQIKPEYFEDHQFQISSRLGGDLSKSAKTGLIVEKLAFPVPKTGCKPKKSLVNTGVTKEKSFTLLCPTQKLNAVIFRDSFFAFLQGSIARYFQRSTYIEAKLNFRLLQKYIQQEKPDIVIDQVLERIFPYQPTEEFLFANKLKSE